MEKKFDLLGMELPTIDLVAQIPCLPTPDQAGMDMEAMILNPAGNTASAIVAAALLGAKTAFIGRVPGDLMGKFMLDDFVYNGVDCSRMKVIAGKHTGIQIILSDQATNGRAMIGYFGDIDPIQEEDLDEEYIAQSKIFHLEDHCAPFLPTIIEMAEKYDTKLSIDLGGYKENLQPYIDQFNIVIASERFYKAKFGEDDTNYVENCKKMIQGKNEFFVVTLGSKGCVGATKNGDSFTLPAFSGEHIVDTCGCGDTFHGSFLYGYLHGWPLENCARFASGFSYINACSIGSRAGMPDLDTLNNFLHTGEINWDQINARREHYANAFLNDPNVFSMDKNETKPAE